MADTTQKITLIAEAEDRTKETLKQVEANVSSMGEKIKSNLTAIAGISATAGVAFAGIISASRSALDAFAGAEAQTVASTKQLENAVSSLNSKEMKTLTKQLGGTKDVLGTLKGAMDDAGKSALKLGFDDEDASASFSRFFTATKNKDQALKMLTLSMDLARAKNVDLETASKAVNMAMDGNAKGLKDIGIKAQEGATGMQILKIAMETTKGQAEAFADTTAGKMEIANRQMESLQENVGQALAPAFGRLAEALIPVVTKIADFVNEHPKLTGALIAIVAGVTGLVAVVGLLAVAWGALTMVTLPVVGIIAGIVVAVTALVALFLYWDEVVAFLKQTWQTFWESLKELTFRAVEEVKVLFGAFSQWLKESMEAIKGAFILAWESVKEITVRVFDFIKNYFSIWGLALKLLVLESMKAIYAGITEIWGKVKGFFVETWDGIKNVFKGSVDFIMGLIDTFMAKVQAMTATVATAVNLIKGGVSTGISSVTSVFKRATGGSVSPNTPYVVGENGQEVFVPNTYGSILNSSQLAGLGGGGVTINITGNQFLDETGAEKIGNELMKVLKLNVKI